MTDISLYLGQVFGLYLIIVGLIVLVKDEVFLPVVGAFLKDRVDRTMVSIIEVLAGLFYVVAFQEWWSVYVGILSFIGWAMLAEGIFYATAPERWIQWVARTFNVRGWYVIGGVGSIVIGAYLALVGFGLIYA